jgi:hypothetical protein
VKRHVAPAIDSGSWVALDASSLPLISLLLLRFAVETLPSAMHESSRLLAYAATRTHAGRSAVERASHTQSLQFCFVHGAIWSSLVELSDDEDKSRLSAENCDAIRRSKGFNSSW